MLSKLEEFLQGLLRRAAEGHAFLVTCAGLALLGTLTAAYPVTAVVVPATLLAAPRWKQISIAAAIGSTVGATALVFLIHHMGWSNLYEYYPQLASHPDWMKVMSWVEQYGKLALFLVALSPLPQTPALIFFGMTRPDYLSVFIAVLAGKLPKYAVFAWGAKRFPAAFGKGLSGIWRRFRAERIPANQRCK